MEEGEDNQLGGYEEEEYDEEGQIIKPGKKKKELSDVEKAKIKQTIEEMKRNQIQPQKIIGKKDFDKPGFVSNPAKIVYKDFEVGKKMSLTIEIINVSYVFNSFHPQPLDDEIIDFFEIDYQPCGRIPAGISTKMTLHFTPLVNKDYKSSLKLLSETGMCVIPIECYCKKCIINFQKNVLDYGNVIIGQEINIPLVVTNSGALNCKYTVVDSEKELLTEKMEDEEVDPYADLEASYKDFTDRSIILHKFDFKKDQEKCENDKTLIDKIKVKRVEEYKIKLMNEAREAYEKEEKEKEKEEQQQTSQGNNPNDKNSKNKAPPQKVVKKPAGKEKEKEPQVELVDGIPKERFDEIELKVKDYSENFKIEKEEDQKEYDKILSINKFNSMKVFLLKQIKYPLYGQFNGYSKKNVSFVLNARFIGEFDLDCFLKIEYKDKTEYKEFKIKFNIVDLPINREKKIYDLNYIIVNQIFREKIILINKSPIPYKLQIFFHKDLNDYIELNPSLGYIQANSSFEIWLKLKVDKNIDNLVSFFMGQDTDDNIEYNFPLKIVLNNISIPLITVIHFFVTTDRVKISEKMINYGKRFLDESTKVKVSLQNMSHLPMRYGFIMLPKEFSVITNIDNLLSKEKRFVDIIYEPKDGFVGHREGDIFCRVITDELTTQNIKIKYHIELVKPEIVITPKKICFQALPEGEYEELRLTITNENESKEFDCEFMTPPKCISGLTIMPKVFTIPAKKYTTCVIRYDSAMREYGPYTYEEIEKELGIKLSDGMNQLEKDTEIQGNQNNLLEEKIKTEIDNTLGNAEEAEGGKKKKGGAADKKVEKKPEPKKAEAKKDKKQLEEEEKKKKEEEELKLKEEQLKKEERLKNYNREEELRGFGAENTFKNIPGDRSCHWSFNIPLFYRMHIDKTNQKEINNNNKTENLKVSFIEVHTTSVEKTLVFDKTEIDFGEVSVQTRKTINLVITNNSNKTAKLKMKSLILTNCFRIVNAIRDLAPHSSFNYIVEFLPQKDLPYFDDFIVYTEKTQSTVHLKGLGVKPEVETSVPDGILFLGNSMSNNTIEGSFDIINKSNFKINFELKSLKTGKKNRTGLMPFCYIPYCGEIEAKGKITIKASFKGDHQDFENYFDFVLIDVPNQKKENKLYIYARCWERQVYWKELTETLYPDQAFLNQVIEQDIFVSSLLIKSNSKSSNNERIVLTFVPESSITLPVIVSKKENVSPNATKTTSKDKKGKKNVKKVVEEPKNENEEINEKCYKRKIIIGNCKLDDSKLEKNGNYEVFLDKDCPYFTCDNPKGAVNSGQELIITFGYKKPDRDPLIKDIECLKGVGMWVESTNEIKINGGYIEGNTQDNVSVFVVLRAYVEQI